MSAVTDAPARTPAPAPARRNTSLGLLRGTGGRAAALLVLLVLLLVAAALSIAVGSRPIGLGTVWEALTTPGLGTEEAVVVRELRVPRTVLGILVGLALGAAGALTQGHTRNPLGDPGLLGVTAGASFAVVLSIRLLDAGSPSEYVWFAFAGALGGTVVVFALGSAGRGGASPVTLALAGSAVTALLYALIQAILVGDQRTLDGFRFWVVGSLAGRDAGVAGQVAPFIVAGLVLALVNAPALDVLGLGEDVARGLGQRIWLARATGLAGVTLLCGAATAACGPIAFVGLIVPHLVRAVTGPRHRWLVPGSALLGAVLLLTADVVGRVVARPAEVQVGIVLAFVGAPFFLALVRRRRLTGL